MAFEKLTYYKDLGKFEWEKALFCGFEIDDNNEQYYKNDDFNKYYYKVVFYFCTQDGLWVSKESDMIDEQLYGSKTAKQYIYDDFRCCGIDTSSDDMHQILTLVKDAIKTRDKFVRISGEVEDKVSASGNTYRACRFYINQIRTSKEINEVDTSSLLSKLDALNSSASATPIAVQSQQSNVAVEQVTTTPQQQPQNQPLPPQTEPEDDIPF